MNQRTEERMDCVELKRKLQEPIIEAIRGKSPEEIVAYFRNRIENSTSELAAEWREGVKKNAEVSRRG